MVAEIGCQMRRRLPRWSAIREFARFQPPSLSRKAKILNAHTIEDLRQLAKRRAPRAAFDYTDGGADEELGLRRARAAFERVEFKPRVLRDVSQVDTHTELLGQPVRMPLALSPTGFTRMMHSSGEPAVAAAAAAAGIPYTLSTLGTTSIEELARCAPSASRWFQLYVWKDRSFSQELVARARSHGYSALMLTVDVPVAGRRLRDVRNGLTIPPRLSLRTIADAAIHPAWWWDLITTEPLTFATLSDSGGTVADLINRVFDPRVTLEDLAWLKETWQGPVIVKGVQSAADAKLVVDAGADALVVSNHGGRQLDRVSATLELLPEVVSAVKDRAEIYIDGGITNGADIAAAIALGANAAMVGRAYLYGLMAGGENGVTRALEILTSEYERTLQLLGVTSTSDLDASYVRLRH